MGDDEEKRTWQIPLDSSYYIWRQWMKNMPSLKLAHSSFLYCEDNVPLYVPQDSFQHCRWRL